ncbi:MAG: hypothetical protein AB7F75_12945 [Planctomycetota bacterium]
MSRRSEWPVVMVNRDPGDRAMREFTRFLAAVAALLLMAAGVFGGVVGLSLANGLLCIGLGFVASVPVWSTN